MPLVSKPKPTPPLAPRLRRIEKTLRGLAAHAAGENADLIRQAADLLREATRHSPEPARSGFVDGNRVRVNRPVSEQHGQLGTVQAVSVGGRVHVKLDDEPMLISYQAAQLELVES